MRYILVIIALMCCSISSRAQTDSTKVKKPKFTVRENKPDALVWDKRKTKAKILSDDVNSDGLRHITTSERTTMSSSEDKAFIVSLRAFESESDGVRYCLEWKYVRSGVEPNIKEGSPVLLKLGNDSILSLSINDVYTPIPYITVVYYSTIKLYTTYFFTYISEEELTLLGNGVKKVRAEIDNAPFDVVLKKDNISQFILEEYGLIKELLKEKKSFYDDF